MEMSINGKVALVTGAGQVIGRAIALRLANDGADVAIADLNEEKMRTVADEVKAVGRKATVVRADVSKRDEEIQGAQVEGQDHRCVVHRGPRGLRVYGSLRRDQVCRSRPNTGCDKEFASDDFTVNAYCPGVVAVHDGTSSSD
jgi:shikimate 5-dehydrogenase